MPFNASVSPISARFISLLLIGFLAVVGCGGGGGSSDYSIDDDGGDADGAGEVDFASLALGAIVDGAFTPGQIAVSIPEGDTLGFGDTATLEATIADGQGDRYTSPVEVTFASDFQRTGQAELNDATTTSNGSAKASYTAQGGSGVDTVRATAVVGQKTLTATASIRVAGPDPEAIEFVSATSDVIAIKGTGGPGRAETAWLTFRAIDDEGNPLPGLTVDFELSAEFGLPFDGYTGITNADGLVDVDVTSGDVATSLRVRATIRGTALSALSDVVTVSTGLPDQENFSLLAADLGFDSTLGYRYSITAHAFDHFNNPVPDGAVISFSAEQGQIQDQCVTTDGLCTVTWQNTVPPTGVTILATVPGEETFVDVDEDGFFSETDAQEWQAATYDLPFEPFRDDNQNGIFERGEEQFRDYNRNGAFDSLENGIFNGVLCSDSAEAQNLCSKELLLVRSDVVLGVDATFSEVRLGAMIDGVFAEGSLAVSVGDGEQLAHSGTATVKATVVDQNDDPIQMPLDIRFASEFAEDNKAQIDELVRTVNGVASAVYKAESGAGIDTITATLTIGEKVKTAEAIIDVAGASAGIIDFESVSPTTIALAGTGGAGLSKIAKVIFEVLDIFGNPSPNQTVDFELSTAVGGLTINPTEAVTNSKGQAVTYVQSGNVATSVRVKATVRGTLITTQSDRLIVSTGLPDQNSFSLSADVLNPEAWQYDGQVVSIGIIASDHFNNPVPDGTAIYFTTEGGQIEDQCFTTDGYCSVDWKSSEPRPENGRVTILATAIGEESFIDVDGDGLFTEEDKENWDEETFDLPEEAFRDDDESGDFNPYSEEFIDFNNNGFFDSNDDDDQKIYNGVLCDVEAELAELCSKTLLNVRANIPIVMSGSIATICFDPEDEVDPTSANGFVKQKVLISIFDENGQVMPKGTTVTVTATNGNLVGANEDGEVKFEVPNSATTLPGKNALCLDGEEGKRGETLFEVTVEKMNGGSETEIKVVVKTPKGHESIETESL